MRLADGAENWPQWRGPAGNGTSDSTNLPTEWNLDKNIVWRTELPSWSGGTPVGDPRVLPTGGVNVANVAAAAAGAAAASAAIAAIRAAPS
jgi:hypothetical protein